MAVRLNNFARADGSASGLINRTDRFNSFHAHVKNTDNNDNNRGEIGRHTRFKP